ncbi:MAG: hypothetical protein ACLKAO_03915 [Alkaliphilus sp.]
MSTNTVNFVLVKPASNDFYDRGIDNSNLDKIDTEIKNSRNADNHVDGVNNKVYLSTEKAKLAGIANNANKYVHPVTHSVDMIAETTTKKFMSNVEKTKLAGIATNANKYVHPATHSPTLITQNASNRFTTDTEKANWNGKINKSGDTVTGLLDINRIGHDDDGVYVPYPEGASARNLGGSTGVGTIKITLPVSFTNTMVQFIIDVYDYTTNGKFTVHVGGYNTSIWANPTAYILGSRADRNFNIRFANDGAKDCILIGETTSTWKWLQVTVRNFYGGYSGATLANWADGWDVSLETSFTGITISQTISDSLILAGHWNDNNNPHSVSKSQVGLSLVDNVQQAPLSHLHSIANVSGLQTALNSKAADSNLLDGIDSSGFSRARVGGRNLFVQATAPSVSGRTVGDLWFQT